MTASKAVECDLVISGGTIVDGTGAAARQGDVGVTGDRIRAVTDAGGLTAPRVVDAAGLVVCPGFIDLHSHADFSIAGHPGADTALAQGVTTLLTGNCGWSPFPLADPDALPRATEFLQPELDWGWTDAAGYADAVDATEPAVNIALQVGHSSIRLAVLGSDDRPPHADELVRMRDLVAQAADQGVHGFSTGLIYAPGCYADTAEVAALVRAAAERGLLYSTHMRNESAQLLESVREALDTAAAAGARLEISHLKAMGPSNHGTVDEALRLIDQAAADGVDVSCDVYPYTASSTTLTSFLPTWSMDGGVDRLLERLSDPDTRARVGSELRQQLAGDVDPASIVIADLPPGPLADAVGRSLADVAAGIGTDAADAALRLLGDHRGAVAIVHHGMADRDVSTALAHPLTSVASDGWTMRPNGSGRPHPRSFGTFSRVLGRFVREGGELELTEAVRKMTSLPAARAGLRDRGVLSRGSFADIAVLDPSTVIDRSTFDDPWQLSTGVAHVLVAGQPAVRDGAVTGDRHGKVLRRT